MALTPGTRLGVYEITAPIGEGGMGQVFRARDAKLDREVAIKILPDAFAADPERLARFEREAKTLASLNHPNIAAIYGFEDSQDIHALVMELVEGPTLADRITQGPIPLDDALKIARQIADALEAAHERAVVHRDLKPANIKVRDDGAVKVLDFGLAKAMDVGSSGTGGLSTSPTLTSPAFTQVGVILGTAAYMAPEQARGQAVDRRADIWAFGCVLYEMLAGRQCFASSGESVSDAIAAILRSDPDWSALPAGTPASIRRLLRRCLEKDAKRRLQAIGDARIEIDEAPSGADAVAPLPGTSAPGRSRPRWPWMAAAAVASALAIGASFATYRATRPAERPLMRFTDRLDEEILPYSGLGSTVAISPDGSRLAYVGGRPRHLAVRLLAGAKTTVLAGTQGADAPFFSPDGRWIAYFVNNTIKKVSVDGGAPVTVCEVGGPARGGGFWTDDGAILFAIQRSPIMRVSDAGGVPAPLTKLEDGIASHRGAQLLPGGDAMLFESSADNNAWEKANIHVQSLKSGQRKTLVQGGYAGRYIHGADSWTGHLLYVRDNSLFAAPMDVRRLELTGPAIPVLDDVTQRALNGVANLAVASSGALLYVPGSQRTISLFRLDPAGNQEILGAPPATAYASMQISPDGARMSAVRVQGSTLDLVVYEWAQNRMTKLNNAWKGVVTVSTAWAPDSQHLAFILTSSELSGPGIYWIRADGASEPQRLVAGDNNVPQAITPDGKALVYLHGVPPYTVWTVPLDLADPDHPKAGTPQQLMEEPVDPTPLLISHDGRWIAYSGRPNVVVRPFPGPGGRWQVSTTGGRPMAWTRDGHELVYREANGALMAMSYSVNGNAFVAGQPRPWSDKAVQSAGTFDMSPDGKMLIGPMATPGSGDDERPQHVAVLLNFADELRRKVPSK